MCVTSVPLILVLVVLVLLQFLALMVVAKVENFTRSEFPADFVFGSGSSAYQVGILSVSFKLINSTKFFFFSFLAQNLQV